MLSNFFNSSPAEICMFSGVMLGIFWYIFVLIMHPRWVKQRVKTGWKVYRRRVAASNWIMVSIAAFTFCATTYFATLSWFKVGIIVVLILCCLAVWLTNGKKR